MISGCISAIQKPISPDSGVNLSEMSSRSACFLPEADIYGGLWKIEETFKVTKTGMLSLRPVFHSRQDRIRAHFLICFISLVLERLLELQLGWNYSAKSIQESLSSFNALQLANSNIYQVAYYDVIVDTILKTLDIDISRKFLQQSDIKRIIGQTKKKDYEG